MEGKLERNIEGISGRVVCANLFCVGGRRPVFTRVEKFENETALCPLQDEKLFRLHIAY